MVGGQRRIQPWLPPRGTCAMCLAVLAGALWLDAAQAAPPRPPGGPHRIYRGGDNQAGYPPLSFVGVGGPSTGSGVQLRVLTMPNPARGIARFRVQALRGER